MAIYSLLGYVAGFAGSVAFGLFLGWFGGARTTSAWSAAFAMLILGPVVTSIAVWRARKADPRSGQHPARASCNGMS